MRDSSGPAAWTPGLSRAEDVLTCPFRSLLTKIEGTAAVLEACAVYRRVGRMRTNDHLVGPGHRRGEEGSWRLASSVWPMGTIARRFTSEGRGRAPWSSRLFPPRVDTPLRQPA